MMEVTRPVLTKTPRARHGLMLESVTTTLATWESTARNPAMFVGVAMVSLIVQDGATLVTANKATSGS